MKGQVGGFQNPGVCLQAFPSFPFPSPSFLVLALAPFFARAKRRKSLLCSPTPRKRLLRKLRQPSTSNGTGWSISQLKPPGNLNFGNPSELPHAWKRWKEEITLYRDLALEGRDERMKVKLFLYIIGNQGREIYDTLPFTRGPSGRSLQDVIDALETHCNPKKNETV